jgi:hypothetical protein
MSAMGRKLTLAAARKADLRDRRRATHLMPTGRDTGTVAE